ncbi:hypothetical protein HSBAA_PA_1880 (plasmid) [Vreelandella sulfidaeris]|uniref:DUF6242 domain-containing protein n=1 Tax=Vreelandella sulfidaeris TaxID=115553 RepID=A0A455UHG3_9GAMM|nr:hypothetical protein HSBAA_PA_1880 [Halomonas sulfidaeris]
MHYDVTGKRLFKIEANQLFQRTDEGMAWNAIPLPEDVTEGQLLAVSVPYTDSQTLYIAGTSIGVQRSTDNGETWQELSANLPSRVTALTVHRRQDETLYAVIAENGIYQSEDAGNTWKKMDSGPSQRLTDSFTRTWKAACRPAGFTRYLTMRCVYRWTAFAAGDRPENLMLAASMMWHIALTTQSESMWLLSRAYGVAKRVDKSGNQ